MSQISLWHTDEFGADGIPDWERRRLHRLAVEFYGGLCAAHAGPGTPLSLANCEKVPTSTGEPEPSGDFPETADDLDGIPVALEAIRAAISRDRERQRKVLALIEGGEAVHARRLATCRQKSVQLECPDNWEAEGCGSTDNYVPINCDSRLCPDCMNRKQGQVAGQYRSVVKDWGHATALRLSLDRRVDPDDLEQAVDALRGAFGRLRCRVIPVEGDGWSWADWKGSLRMVGAHDLARHLQKRYVEQGRGVPFDEAVRTGFYGIHIKQGQDGSLNVHLHVLADVPWLPQAALSALWDDLTDAPVVDIRRVDGTEEGALMDVIGYAAKAPEFESLEDQVAYLQTLKGSKLIQPFGELHGNTPDVAAMLLCENCGMSPRWWNYLGTVDGEYTTVEIATEQGDRPPPDP